MTRCRREMCQLSVNLSLGHMVLLQHLQKLKPPRHSPPQIKLLLSDALHRQWSCFRFYRNQIYCYFFFGLCSINIRSRLSHLIADSITSSIAIWNAGGPWRCPIHVLCDLYLRPLLGGLSVKQTSRGKAPTLWVVLFCFFFFGAGENLVGPVPRLLSPRWSHGVKFISCYDFLNNPEVYAISRLFKIVVWRCGFTRVKKVAIQNISHRCGFRLDSQSCLFVQSLDMCVWLIFHIWRDCRVSHADCVAKVDCRTSAWNILWPALIYLFIFSFQKAYSKYPLTIKQKWTFT